VVRTVHAQAEMQRQIAPDRPVIRINWPRVAVVGLLAAIVAILLTLVFRAASERNAQAVSDGPVAAAQASSAPQVDPPIPQLVARPAVDGTDDRLPLGISVHGPREIILAAAIEIVGLPGGWTLSAGRPFGENGWRLPVAKLPGVVIQPPRGFAGAIDIAVELRLADDTLVERRSVRRARIAQARATDSDEPTEPVRSIAIDSPPTSVLLEENIASEQVASNVGEPDSGQIVLLLRVAEGLFAAGDLSAARTLLRRAAKAGNARAALLLGETYDPGFGGRFGVGSLHTSPAAARAWYEVARGLGSFDARRRLDRLAHDEPWGDLPSRP
jgi:hypothetical protein